MKKIGLYKLAALSLTGLLTPVLIANSNNSSLAFLAKASATVVYKHYTAIEATNNEHGCREFWVSCSDYSYSLTAPTDGTIVEGGSIKDNTHFDWNAMDILDGRYVPSTSELEKWGMKPVLNLENNKITYGLWPQFLVEDYDTLTALQDLDGSSISDVSGYYYYNGNFYQNCIGYKRDSDSHFCNGEKVVDGTKYWFLCEPIEWNIMTNTGSTYLMYSNAPLHAGITWGYTSSDTYEQSQVREWLNGIGNYAGNGFFQTALFGSNQYVQNMTISLDDGSSTLNDNVRLLTKDEASNTTYFANNNARKVNITDWTAAHRACFQNSGSNIGRWWLCEANTDNTNNAWGVGLDGAVGNGGSKTTGDSYDRCERPVITITIA